MKNKIFALEKPALFLFFFVLCAISAFPQGISSDIELSRGLLQRLRGEGYSARSLPLVALEEFPFNISLDFRSKTATLDDLIISAKQEDLLLHADFFDTLLDFASKNEFKYNLRFVFTAGDNRKIAGNQRTTGAAVYSRTLEGLQRTNALLLDFNATKKNYITPGSKGEISPYYLTRAICDALDEKSIDYALSGGMYISLYNLGILKSEERLSDFLSQEIPSILFAMLKNKSDYTKELGAIETFLLKLNPPQTNAWSRHYFPVKVAAKRFWITERQMILMVMAFIALVLLVISDLVFFFRKKSAFLIATQKRALKSTYLIFVTAAILAMSLLLGQLIARGLLQIGVRNVLLLFIIKISTPFFLISASFAFELKIHKNLPPYVYEYILGISALLNVFLFSMVDISLFFLFSFEYLILSLSRTVKRTILLYVFMTLFLLPFIPLVYLVLIYSDPGTIAQILFCKLGGNILMSFALMPLSLLWLRVLVRLNFKYSSRKKLIANYSIAHALIIGGIVVFTVPFIFILNRLFFNTVEAPRFLLRPMDSQKIAMSVSVYDTEYYGGKIRHVEITSPQNAERYSVIIEGRGNINPVYFSIYETDYNDGKAEFLLPENPPQNLNVLYTPDESTTSIIRVEGYFLSDDEKSAYKETFLLDTAINRIATKSTAPNAGLYEDNEEYLEAYTEENSGFGDEI